MSLFQCRLFARACRCLTGIAIAVISGLALAQPRTAQASEAIHLRIVGGLGGVHQFRQHEAPFWTERLRALSDGRLTASVHPFDQIGLAGRDMLNLMRLGVVPFGTALLAHAEVDEPELAEIDLPSLNPDFASLERSIAQYRPHVARILKERYQLRLLGIYSYPAQVVFCSEPMAGLSDLSGRRVRTSSIGQAELLEGLGAIPVILPFSETTQAIARKIVDCAITGTLSGNEIGLSKITSHMHMFAVTWGLSLFAANEAALAALPPDLQTLLIDAVGELEGQIRASASRDTLNGAWCNAGDLRCEGARKDRMTIVHPDKRDDEARRRLLLDVVLPRWTERCGQPCIDSWNEYQSSATGIQLKAEGGAGRATMPSEAHRQASAASAQPVER